MGNKVTLAEVVEDRPVHDRPQNFDRQIDDIKHKINTVGEKFDESVYKAQAELEKHKSMFKNRQEFEKQLQDMTPRLSKQDEDVLRKCSADAMWKV